jgi:hypothetical protein
MSSDPKTSQRAASTIVKLQRPQAIVTFFGSASRVDLGNTMLNTPFAMDALMSSFYTKSHQYISAAEWVILKCLP